MLINFLIYATNENITYVKTTLYSLLINKDSTSSYRIFCLCHKDDQINSQITSMFKNEKHFGINYIEVDKLIVDLNLENDYDFTKCFMFYLNRIFDEINIKIGLKRHNEYIKKRVNEECLNKIIYLNHNVIIQEDMNDLWKINLSDHEYFGFIYNPFNENQIYDDVVIINVNRISNVEIKTDKYEKGSSKKIINSNYNSIIMKIVKSGIELNKIVDAKPILLEYFNECIKELDLKFGLINIDYNKYYHVLANSDQEINKKDLKIILNSINKPHIINFIELPWIEDHVIYQDIWKQYYKQSLYYEYINNLN